VNLKGVLKTSAQKGDKHLEKTLSIFNIKTEDGRELAADGQRGATKQQRSLEELANRPNLSSQHFVKSLVNKEYGESW